MKQILTIFAFTFRDAVRKKAFIITTIIILGLIVLLSAIPGLVASVDGGTQDPGTAEPDESLPVCYYIDEEVLIENGLETLSDTITSIRFEKGEPAKIAEYKEAVKADGDSSIIQINKGSDGLPVIAFTNKDFMSRVSASEISELLSDIYISNTLNSKGIDEETIAFAQSTLDMTQEFVGGMDFSGYMLGIVLTMLIFFAIYFYGYGVSMSVATEKTSRVIETLVVSSKPSRILIGKCLGMGLAGLSQFVLFILAGALCYKYILPDDFMLFGMEISLSAFTAKSAIFTIIYFLLGYTLYAMMNAVSGAYVSKIEDLNSAMMPVMMIAMISFYVGYFSIMSPNNVLLNKLTLYVPFISPFIMPFNLLNSDLSNADLLISIATLVVTIIIVTATSIKIYTASVLHYGKGLKLK